MEKKWRWGSTALLLLALATLLAACGAGAPKSDSSSSAAVSPSTAQPAAAGLTSTAPSVRGPLTIFAAASLTDAFRQIGTNIEQANSGVKLTFNFAGSPTLRTQLAQGAKADVFASADQPNMQGAQQDGSVAGEPRIFAQNRLVVIVPASSSTAPAQLKDLSKPGVKVVLAQQSVPVGNYARQSFAKMSQDPAFGSDFSTSVLKNLVSEELDVKGVVSKVQLGEADAGVTYATDVTPAVKGAVKMIAIPDQFNIIASYPIAVVKGAPNAAGAQAFIDYVLSPAGQSTLKDWGFVPSNG